MADGPFADFWDARLPIEAIGIRLGAAILFGTAIGLDRRLRPLRS